MKTIFLRGTAIAAVLCCPAALLAQATPERAAEIAASLSRYLPPAEGALTVAPEGGSYRVTLDFAPYIARMPQGLGTLSASPLGMTLTETDDGLFEVAYDQSFSLHLAVEDALLLDMRIDRMAGGGTFDPALGAFLRSEDMLTGMTMTEEITDPNGRMHVDYRIETMTGRTTGRPGAQGGADIDLTFTATGIAETFTLPLTPGQPPMPLSLSAASYEGEGTLAGMQTLPVLEAVAWFLAQPGPEAIAAAQAEGKEKLRAALPVFRSLSITGTMTDVTIGTPVGEITAASGGAEVAMNGLVADGRVFEKLSLAGVTLPAGLVPGWAAPLLPQDLTLSFDFTGFDLAAAAAIFLDKVDWAQGPDPMLEQELTASLLPKGSMDIAFGIGSEAAGTWKLESDGALSVGPMALPVGRSTVRLTGIDAILAALGSAPPEVSQGAVPAIGMARGLGRAEGEATVWDIEFTPEGKLLVNGNDMSMFMQ